MSKKKNNRAEAVEVEQETIDTTLTITEVDPVEQVDVPVVAAEPEFATGQITGCHSLNVREHPTTEAKVLGVLTAASEVQIDVSNDYADWYRIFTASGIDGFCMKKYISIKA